MAQRAGPSRPAGLNRHRIRHLQNLVGVIIYLKCTAANALQIVLAHARVRVVLSPTKRLHSSIWNQLQLLFALRCHHLHPSPQAHSL
jgi:hypothetical protein